MSKLSDRIIQVLIRKDISIHAQLFRFMSLLGTIAMAVGGVYTLAEGMEIKNVAALFAGALFMGMLFWAGNKFQQSDLCSFILMSGLNGIFLPVTFLRSGGLKSGMPLRCVQLRKHSKAREKRYSFGYAVSFIFACYQILWTFPKSQYLCSRYLPLVCG